MKKMQEEYWRKIALAWSCLVVFGPMFLHILKLPSYAVLLFFGIWLFSALFIFSKAKVLYAER